MACSRSNDAEWCRESLFVLLQSVTGFFGDADMRAAFRTRKGKYIIYREVNYFEEIAQPPVRTVRTKLDRLRQVRLNSANTLVALDRHEQQGTVVSIVSSWST